MKLSPTTIEMCLDVIQQMHVPLLDEQRNPNPTYRQDSENLARAAEELVAVRDEQQEVEQ